MEGDWMEKVLIIQTAFLGDLILTTPFFHQIRTIHPQASIHVVVNRGTESVLDGNPDLDKILTLDKKRAKNELMYFWEFAQSLRREKYATVYCPHFSYRSTLLSWFTGAKVRVGYRESGFSFLHTRTVPRPRTGPHEVEKLFSLIYSRPSDYPQGRERRPYLFFPVSVLESARTKLQTLVDLGKPICLLAPSSLWETKRYPDESFSEFLALLLTHTEDSVVLTGSPADQDLSRRIGERLAIMLDIPWENRFLDLTGLTSLSELGAIVSLVDRVVSNDSSPVHYASAFNKPTLMIYGATVPEFGYSTLSEVQEIAQIQGLECRPCGIHGGRICPQTHFRCMKDLKAQTLLEQYRRIC